MKTLGEILAVIVSLLTSAGILVGFIFWLSALASTVEDNAATIEEINLELTTQRVMFNKIYHSLGRIEGKLGTKPKENKNGMDTRKR